MLEINKSLLLHLVGLSILFTHNHNKSDSNKYSEPAIYNVPIIVFTLWPSELLERVEQFSYRVQKVKIKKVK